MKDTKIVLNKCYGKFNLSHKAILLYAKLKNIKLCFWLTKNGFRYTVGAKEDYRIQIFCIHYINLINRTDKHLIEVIEKLGNRASGIGAKLEIEELIPNKIWYIENYSGIEEIKYL